MPKLDEIIEEWKKDCKIEETDLSNESLKTPKLHSKYYEWYTKENMMLKKTNQDYYKLLKRKIEYFSGRLSQDELKEFGWEPFDLVLTKQDLEIYINADEDLSTEKMKIALQEEKVEALREIIKCLNNRAYVIKNAVDFMKFSNGC